MEPPQKFVQPRPRCEGDSYIHVLPVIHNILVLAKFHVFENFPSLTFWAPLEAATQSQQDGCGLAYLQVLMLHHVAAAPLAMSGIACVAFAVLIRQIT